ncbi:MAG: extracellular solute-binding protein [Chloroflexi bacterium]|nr:extracellular solute-binding protein [Chloroflexota bacterium]MCY3582959.1 extracellular solute-binding protein [Chloroflexota bacterium]MCY3716863.1 extracellular solute-binding protein [Chloroflexota bacterium]MDE2649254.1 extracellular solute-binding protein [Chloroflexota bacterium]MXX82953.1 extracellular solute-binding protein [Chloroflexota bacterium]
MKNRKSLFILLAIALLLPTLLAAAQDQTVVRISWWGSQNRHDRTIAAIELYEELNPDIDIVYEFQGWGDHWTKLSTQAAGGELPDIMQHDYARIEEWVANGLLMPLDGYIESGVIDTSHIADSSLAGGMVDGQMYGINLGNNSEVFTLDTDAFAAAGIELPPLDWTWTQFEDIANQIQSELGIHGIGVLTSDQLWKSYYMGCCDQWAYAADGMSLGYEDDQPLIDYYSMLLRLQESGGMQSYEDSVARGDQGVEAQLIVSQEAAMAYHWSNQIVAVWNASGAERNFVMYPIPRPEGGQSQNYIKPSMFFSITSQADHPDEAAAFIDWFVNSIEANEILAAERGVPVSSVVRDSMMPTLGPAQAEMFNYLGIIEMDNSPIRPADPAAHADVIGSIFSPEFVEPVMYGMISPEEAAPYLREEANRILAAQ